MPPPDLEARHDILRIALAKTPHSPEVLDALPALAKETEGLSGAETVALVREAAMSAIAESTKARQVELPHLTAAVKGALASRRITPAMLSFYSGFQTRGRKR